MLKYEEHEETCRAVDCYDHSIPTESKKYIFLMGFLQKPSNLPEHVFILHAQDSHVLIGLQLHTAMVMSVQKCWGCGEIKCVLWVKLMFFLLSLDKSNEDSEVIRLGV